MTEPDPRYVVYPTCTVSKAGDHDGPSPSLLRDDIDYSPTPRTQPYAEMQKQIGKILREQYQPPQELPHQLLVLLLKVDQQGSRREKKW
jgi:hypothetical protein